MAIVVLTGLLLIHVATVTVSAASFEPRYDAPNSSNSYYYSSNTFYINGYGMPNCTCYAYGRAYELLGTEPSLSHGNAGPWYWYNKSRSIYPYGSTPKLGAIACWDKYDQDKGHVAIVEAINGNTVTISESHYSGTYFDTRTINSNSSNYLTSMRFLGYIYIGDFIDKDDPVDLGDNFYAFIINTKMWKHLTVEQNNHVVIRGEKTNHCADQLWRFERQSDNSYKIVSLANGLCLDVDNASSESGTIVKTYNDNGNDAQRWFLYKKDNGLLLKSKCTDCVLDIQGGDSKDGTPVQMFERNDSDAQIFTVYQLKESELDNHTFSANPGDDFTAPILNLKEWITLENCDNGDVALQNETGKSNQLWRFRRQIDGSYKIFSCYDGKCIDLDNAAHENGTNIKIWGSNDNDAQRWYLYGYGGGYSIQSKASGKFFDVKGGSLNVGTSIQSWEWNGSDAQVFAIYRGNECKLGAVVLSAKGGDNNVILNWTSTYGESAYVLKLWQGEAQEGEPYLVKKDIPARSRNVTIELPSGYYEGYLLSQNYFESYTSNTVGFFVEEKPTELPTESPTLQVAEPTTMPPTAMPTDPPFIYPTEPPVHVHELIKVPEIPAAYTSSGVKAHYKCSGCDLLFADATGNVIVTMDDLYIPPLSAPTDEPTEKPTEAPTETPTQAPTEAPTESPTTEPTENPASAPTEHPTTAPVSRPGDVNGDGDVNNRDAMILDRYVAGWPGYYKHIKDMDAADLSGDGVINNRDAMILDRAVAGWTGYYEKYCIAVKV